MSDVTTLAATLPKAAIEAAWREGSQWTGGADEEFYARIVAAALPHVRDELLAGMRTTGAVWVSRRDADALLHAMNSLRAEIKNGAATADIALRCGMIHGGLVKAFNLEMG